MATSNEFSLQARVAGSPNCGTHMMALPLDVKAGLNLGGVIDTPLDQVTSVLQKREAGSPNCGTNAFFMGLSEAAIPTHKIRSDHFGNAKSDQKRRGGL